MDVVLLGATGGIGSLVLEELLSRSMNVVAVARNCESIRPERPGLSVHEGDVFDEDVVARLLDYGRTVVCCIAMRDAVQRSRTPLDLARVLMRAAATQNCRLVMVGGAGSLQDESGRDLVDTPDAIPAFARVESAGFRDALVALRTSAPDNLVWTFVSPPLDIEFNGVRTGTYRVGADNPVRDAQGRSRISGADLAVAIVDEVERPTRARARFTVAN